MTIRMKTRQFTTVGVPTETSFFIIQGYHDFKLLDQTPEETEERRVFDITHDMENYSERDTCGRYYKCYAVVEGDDIELVAVEMAGDADD